MGFKDVRNAIALMDTRAASTPVTVRTNSQHDGSGGRAGRPVHARTSNSTLNHDCLRAFPFSPAPTAASDKHARPKATEKTYMLSASFAREVQETSSRNTVERHGDGNGGGRHDNLPAPKLRSDETESVARGTSKPRFHLLQTDRCARVDRHPQRLHNSDRV